MRSGVSCSVPIKGSAAKELAGIPQPARARIVHAVDSLREQSLAGTPLKGGLRGLRRLSVGDDRIRVILGYAERETREPRRAIELDQGPGTIRQSSEGRLSSELHAIMSVVPSHSSGALRQEYLRKGNIHRDWNLERISWSASEGQSVDG